MKPIVRIEGAPEVSYFSDLNPMPTLIAIGYRVAIFLGVAWVVISVVIAVGGEKVTGLEESPLGEWALPYYCVGTCLSGLLALTAGLGLKMRQGWARKFSVTTWAVSVCFVAIQYPLLTLRFSRSVALVLVVLYEIPWLAALLFSAWYFYLKPNVVAYFASPMLPAGGQPPELAVHPREAIAPPAITNFHWLNRIGYFFAGLSALMWVLPFAMSFGVSAGAQGEAGSRSVIGGVLVVLALVGHIGAWATALVVWTKVPRKGCLHLAALVGLIPFGVFWGFVYLFVSLPLSNDRPAQIVETTTVGGMIGP